MNEQKKYSCNKCKEKVKTRNKLEINNKKIKLCKKCYPKGLFCKNCLSTKIKSKMNKYYGKTKLIRKNCKNCLSTKIDHINNYKEDYKTI